MNELSTTPPGWPMRLLQFPLTRLVLLGGGVYVLLGVKNGFAQQLAAAPWLALAAVAGMAALAVGVYAGFVRFVERRPVSELAPQGLGRELGAGLLLGAGLYTLCVGVLMLLGGYRIDGLNPWHFMLPAVAMALGSGVFEELVFRGAVFRIAEEVFGSWAALLLSALLFGATHLHNAQATLTGAVFISVEAGLLLAAAYMVTRRLWLSMGFHMAWNFTQSGIFSGIVSGNDLPPGLVQATIQGPVLLTGGPFGLEASVIAFVVCTTAGVLMLRQAVHRGHIRPPFWQRRGGVLTGQQAPAPPPRPPSH